MKKITENDFFFVLSPAFKAQYRAAINQINNGDKEALKTQKELMEMLTKRINAHLGDGMKKPKGIKKGIIF